jgi:hypothetical protein
MLRAASVLIVLAFGANPIVTLVCDLECQAISHADPAHGCHGARHASKPAVQAGMDACTRVSAVGPFVIEGGHTGLAARSELLMTAVVARPRFDAYHDRGALLLRLLREGASPPPRTPATVLRV